MIKFKCWYYDVAIADGNDKKVKNITPEEMPEDISKAYFNTY